MSTSSIPALNTTLEKTHLWLSDLTEIGRFHNEAQAYSVLRGVMHALRDRLPAGEAAHVAAQLPMLLRGLYYEGWKPAGEPTRERSAHEFLESVRAHMGGNLDPAHATQAVFEFLTTKLSPGIIDDILRILPEGIARLWPQSEPAGQSGPRCR
jgi:uncharacterized protein (DUF2267 family)